MWSSYAARTAHQVRAEGLRPPLALLNAPLLSLALFAQITPWAFQQYVAAGVQGERVPVPEGKRLSRDD